MEEKDKIQFAKILTGLSELYGKDISSGAMELWYQALKQYDIEAIATASSAHVNNPDTGQFFPKPADIVRMIGGTSKDAAYAAWSKVEVAVERVGTHRSVAFDDPLIHRVVQDMGGWVCVGEKSGEEWPFVKNEFVNRYQGYRSRAESFDYPPRLIGQSEVENRRNGYLDFIQPPQLIGAPETAKAVMAGGSDKPMIEYTNVASALDSGLKQIAEDKVKPQLMAVK